MAVKLWGSKTPGNAQDVRDLNLLKNKKKVIKMLVIVVVLFCVAWFPLQLYNVLQVTYPEVNEYQYINIIWLCFDWLAMSNSCYNPFIYGIYNVSLKSSRERFQRRKLLAIDRKFSHRTFQFNCRKSLSESSTNASQSFTSMDLVNVSISRQAEWTQVLPHSPITKRKLCQCTTHGHQFRIIRLILWRSPVASVMKTCFGVEMATGWSLKTHTLPTMTTKTTHRIRSSRTTDATIQKWKRTILSSPKSFKMAIN